MIFILVLGLIYFLFLSPFFKIKKVIINQTSTEEISQLFHKLEGTNIFRIRTKNIQNDLTQKYPQVKGIKISRGLPDTLKVEFSERPAILIWETQDQKYLVDSHGEIYTLSQELNDLPVIKDNNNIKVDIGQKILSESFINFVLEINMSFTAETGFKINRFEVNETTFQLDGITDQGWKIIFDTARKSDEQLSDLNKFLKDNKDSISQYVDLRIEGRVYYK